MYIGEKFNGNDNQPYLQLLMWLFWCTVCFTLPPSPKALFPSLAFPKVHNALSEMYRYRSGEQEERRKSCFLLGERKWRISVFREHRGVCSTVDSNISNIVSRIMKWLIDWLVDEEDFPLPQFWSVCLSSPVSWHQCPNIWCHLMKVLQVCQSTTLLQNYRKRQCSTF